MLLASGRFAVSQTIIPEAQEHFLTPSAHRDTHIFGGLGVNRVRITAPHEQLIITAVGEVHLFPTAPEVYDMPLASVQYDLAASELLSPSPLVNPSSVVVARIASDHADTLLDTVGNVNRWVHEHVRYQRGPTSVNTTAADVLNSMVGVC